LEMPLLMFFTNKPQCHLANSCDESDRWVPSNV
jgi:hypothetical protein